MKTWENSVDVKPKEAYAGQFADYELRVWKALDDVKASRSGASLLKIFEEAEPVNFLAPSGWEKYTEPSNWLKEDGTPSDIKLIIHPAQSSFSRPASVLGYTKYPLGTRSAIGLNIDELIEAPGLEARDHSMAVHKSGTTFHEVRHSAAFLLGLSFHLDNFAAYEYTPEGFDAWRNGYRIPAEEMATFGGWEDTKTYRGTEYVNVPDGTNKPAKVAYREAQTAASTGESFGKALDRIKTESDAHLDRFEQEWRASKGSPIDPGQEEALKKYRTHRSKVLGLSEKKFMDEKKYPRRLLYTGLDMDSKKVTFKLQGRELPSGDELWESLHDPLSSDFFKGYRDVHTCTAHGWVRQATLCLLEEAGDPPQFATPKPIESKDKMKWFIDAATEEDFAEFKRKLIAAGVQEERKSWDQVESIKALKKAYSAKLLSSYDKKFGRPDWYAQLASVIAVEGLVSKDPQLSGAQDGKLYVFKSPKFSLELTPTQFKMWQVMLDHELERLHADPELEAHLKSVGTGQKWTEKDFKAALSREALGKFVRTSAKKSVAGIENVADVAGFALSLKNIADVASNPNANEWDQVEAFSSFIPILADIVTIISGTAQGDVLQIMSGVTSFAALALGFACPPCGLAVGAALLLKSGIETALDKKNWKQTAAWFNYETELAAWRNTYTSATYSANPFNLHCDEARGEVGLMATVPWTYTSCPFATEKADKGAPAPPERPEWTPKKVFVDPDSWAVRCNYDPKCYVKLTRNWVVLYHTGGGYNYYLGPVNPGTPVYGWEARPTVEVITVEDSKKIPSSSETPEKERIEIRRGPDFDAETIKRALVCLDFNPDYNKACDEKMAEFDKKWEAAKIGRPENEFLGFAAALAESMDPNLTLPPCVPIEQRADLLSGIPGVSPLSLGTAGLISKMGALFCESSSSTAPQPVS
ncbi:hypothetical protein ACFCYM_32170 [Streptomyces sp. NPDC056254]|uniref:hypothetical protein n=1 Tax=Streptomyces sp. NPDC056254 TaxID=3345763 RepID=UPI0035E38DC9